VDDPLATPGRPSAPTTWEAVRAAAPDLPRLVDSLELLARETAAA
jgi:hypothetical protein